jgi:hypothetical protein
MPKETLKRALGAKGDTSLIDTDRIIPKAEGGTYDDLSKVRLMEPRAHMKRHGILRIRELALEELKAVFDDRVQTIKLLNKIDNQLRALTRRTDHMLADMQRFLDEMRQPVLIRRLHDDAEVERLLTEYIANGNGKQPPKRRKKRTAETEAPTPGYQVALTRAALGVLGLGKITAAGLLIYVDIAKAASASALWSYAGLHKASHERYEKGKASGGNKTLRTVLWNMAVSMMKNVNCPYRDVYDRTKARLEHSKKVVQSRNTKGHLISCAWKDTKPCHRDGAALRAIMKHVLADYWFVGRDLAGLPTRPLYVQSQLGHTGIIKPRERGWIW